ARIDLGAGGSSPSPYPNLPVWDAGLQCQRMQLAAHFPLERGVNQLVLLHPGLTAKRLGDHGRRVVIAVTGEIANSYLRVGNARLDQPLDLLGVHRHSKLLPPYMVRSPPPPYRPAASLQNAHSVPTAEWDARPAGSMHHRRLCRAAASELAPVAPP